MGVAGYTRISRHALEKEPARDGLLCPALWLRVRAGEGRRRLPGRRGTWDMSRFFLDLIVSYILAPVYIAISAYLVEFC